MTASPHIVTTPGIRSGRPHIAGSRVETDLVWSVVRHYGRAALRKLYSWPHISDEAIDAAVTFEREERRRSLSAADACYLLSLARLLDRAEGHVEHGSIREALDLACGRLRVDDVEALITTARAVRSEQPEAIAERVNALRSLSADAPEGEPKKTKRGKR